MPGSVESFLAIFEAIHERLQNLDPCMVLVLRLDQGPRRRFSACAGKHLASGRLVIEPLFAVPVVFFRDLETLVACLFTFTKSAQLFFSTDGQPEFEDDDA